MEELEEYYLQDSRTFVGNNVMWWAKAGGYTTDLSFAKVFTREEAVRQNESRDSDIPWPKAYIDARTRPAVDMQYIKRAEALAGTGIVLKAPTKQVRDQARCEGCGVFLSDAQRYSCGCPRCGFDNRP